MHIVSGGFIFISYLYLNVVKLIKLKFDLFNLTEDRYYKFCFQIDNAILFKDLGGLPYILKVMNTTKDEELQMEAALVLGAATST